MSSTYLDKAIEAVPKFEDRIAFFTKKLRLAQYADSTICNYRLKISQAVLYLKKLPDNYTQDDIDKYLSMLLSRNRYSISYFKHTVFGLKDYYKYMGLNEPKGLVLPRVRKAKRLPRVLSQNQVARLIRLCNLYDIPDRFVRIRHYGFLSPCNREILRSIQQQLSVPPVPLPFLVSLLTSFEVWTSTLFYI